MLKNETIVDRVVERLKAQPLGDLITEEDLHDIVKEAIPRVFFQPVKKTDGSGYNARETISDPIIVEVMRDLLKSSAEAAVKKWLVENAEHVAEHWSRVLDAGILKYVQEMQNTLATEQVRAVIRAMFEPINRDRLNSGLPQIFI